jgi:hypothetical protein
MKNHKGNERYNDLTSKNEHKDGFNKPEKHTEPGKGYTPHHPNKGGMQQPGKGMNDGKGYKNEEREEEENEHGKDKSKYFGNYKKTCDTCGTKDCRCNCCD